MCHLLHMFCLTHLFCYGKVGHCMANKRKTTVRLSKRQEEDLKKIKQEQGVSISFIIRRGVNWSIARYKKEVRKDDK
jgi:hypothetical protein